MNATHLMNTVFCQEIFNLAGEFFKSASLQKHNNYRLKVLERCLNTLDVSLLVDFAQTEFSSAPKSKHDKFQKKVNEMWTDFCSREVQERVFQQIEPLLPKATEQTVLAGRSVVIGGYEISADHAKTLTLNALKKLAVKYGRENPQDAMSHVWNKMTDAKTILRHIWLI